MFPSTDWLIETVTYITPHLHICRADHCEFNSLSFIPPIFSSMPPPQPTILAGTGRVSSSKPSDFVAHLFKKLATSSFPLPSLIFFLIFVSCIRCAILFCFRKQKRHSTPCQPLPEKAPTQVTGQPIYPWTSPPQPLPGPYDPRLYPPVTIRRHSHPNPACVAPMETNLINYTRRVSTNSIPSRQSILHGKVTSASNGTTGWRRNHWVVEGG